MNRRKIKRGEVFHENGRTYKHLGGSIIEINRPKHLNPTEKLEYGEERMQNIRSVCRFHTSFHSKTRCLLRKLFQL